jgi:hypothetical protein
VRAVAVVAGAAVLPVSVVVDGRVVEVSGLGGRAVDAVEHGVVDGQALAVTVEQQLGVLTIRHWLKTYIRNHFLRISASKLLFSPSFLGTSMLHILLLQKKKKSLQHSLLSVFIRSQ